MEFFFVTLLLDFSKAFDTVSHQILLLKLHHVGVRGTALSWFSSVLSNRKQCVRVNGVSSDYHDVVMGVPQGSCIGPSLFLLYINDMYRCCPQLDLVHFADDTTVFKSGVDLECLVRDFNQQLSYLDEWLCCNRLSLNVSKTKYMITTNRDSRNHPEVKIRGTTVSEVSEVNFLGIKIDDKLKFDSHVRHVKNKVASATGIMKKLKNCSPVEVRKTIYYSLAFPHLSYGVVAWGSCGRVERAKLQAAQRRMVKLIANSAADVNFFHQRLLDFDDILRYFSAIVMYRIQNQNYHDFLSGKVASLQVPHRYSTRFKAKGNLIGPCSRTTRSQQSFLFAATKYWNVIPEEVRNVETLAKFKAKLKSFLLSIKAAS